MNHHNTETIKNAVEKHIPELEAVLAEHVDGDVDPGITLYMANCGFATAALQRLLDEKYGIQTERVATRLPNPDPNEYKGLNHVVLRHGDTVIDPTPNQFIKMVGLTTERAQNEDLRHLYPTEKVWVTSIAEARERANMFAEHVYNLDQQGLVSQPEQHELGLYGVGVLRGRSLEDMQNVYGDLWDIENYKPYPVSEQREQFTHIGHDLVERVKNS